MTIDERNKMILSYLNFADQIACKKAKNTPPSVSLDELKSAAYMGLVDAAQKFDYSKGIPFGAYAQIRIHGEIQDFLRSLAWGKRGESYSAVSLDNDDEIFPITWYSNEENCSEEFFKKATESLSLVAKRVVLHYHKEGKLLREIAQQLECSVGRVSQILNEAHSVMKRKLNQQEMYEEIAA